ncbi:uncharacterized protein PADG_07212 [Paracoccidioides brasiliensis Pb18]|uniref:Uncharacterized protein n=1 Tax=Paracoccidioides brasiliensis (strain Pb18) TaxID=502780 RepID=C1GIX6_PARBD|nr:uncharacterized protein PADG_07212 [Paracoccidioides brasiliensis Pb18]EEH42392.2 hypothetical protein PADG_07212 [Paracoccidioides brasiliensis Pb18]
MAEWAFKSSNIGRPEMPNQQAGLITAPTVRPVRLRHVEYADLTPSEDGVETPAATSNLLPAINSEELQLRRFDLKCQKIDLELQKERCKELQLQLQLEGLRTQNDRAVMPTNPPVGRLSAWDLNLRSQMQYNLYNPDSRVGKVISQFKQDTKYATKLNALVRSLNYLSWHVNMKAKLIDAQCWVILEDKQVKSPDGDPKWAPFWEAKNRWLYVFILNPLAASIRPCFNNGAGCHIAYDQLQFSQITEVSSSTIQVANKAALKVQGIRVPDLSTNLISAGLLECQGYIHHDLQMDTGNYFEIIASIENDIFYVNLNSNNIYVLSDTPSMFEGNMNDLELEPLAYLTVLKFRAISTDYDLNTASLGLFNHDDVEQLINLKDLDINTFIVFPSI